MKELLQDKDLIDFPNFKLKGKAKDVFALLKLLTQTKPLSAVILKERLN